jgi:hypothetical protein
MCGLSLREARLEAFPGDFLDPIKKGETSDEVGSRCPDPADHLSKKRATAFVRGIGAVCRQPIPADYRPSCC